jgi:Protein of unknown function (DUF4238)
MASIPKQHHYVPKLIQRRFVGPSGQLYFVRRDNPVIKVSNPTDLFKQNHLYSKTSADWVKDPSLELFYADLEGKAGSIISDLISHARRNIHANLSETDRQILIKFIYHMWKRTPEELDRIFPVNSDEEAIYTVDRAMRDMNRQLSDEEFIELLVPGNARRILKNGCIEMLRRDSPDVMQVMAELDIRLVVIPPDGGAFVIGSNPVLPINLRRSAPIVSSRIEVWIPLAREVALCFCDRRQPGVVVASQPIVRKVNELIASRSSILASHSDALLCSLVRAMWGVQVKSHVATGPVGGAGKWGSIR